jgi:hypothetical protein
VLVPAAFEQRLYTHTQVLDKQLQHTLQLGYIPHVEVKSVSALVRVAVAEASHSIALLQLIELFAAGFCTCCCDLQQLRNA